VGVVKSYMGLLRSGGGLLELLSIAHREFLIISNKSQMLIHVWCVVRQGEAMGWDVCGSTTCVGIVC
jgi:hypothetical protein